MLDLRCSTKIFNEKYLGSREFTTFFNRGSLFRGWNVKCYIHTRERKAEENWETFFIAFSVAASCSCELCWRSWRVEKEGGGDDKSWELRIASATKWTDTGHGMLSTSKEENAVWEKHKSSQNDRKTRTLRTGLFNGSKIFTFQAAPHRVRFLIDHAERLNKSVAYTLSHVWIFHIIDQNIAFSTIFHFLAASCQQQHDVRSESSGFLNVNSSGKI